MANIYISSTFKDLEQFRRQVSATLRRMHHVDVAMEYYGAQDARPLDKCLADVAACDLYICIVAWRYGFIPMGQSCSITELEYRQAVESGKPRLVFLLSEDAPWQQSLVERDAYDRVADFRDRLREDRVAAEFMDAADLARGVGEAIYNWERSHGIASAEGRADWEAYRRGVFDTHRWVRLAVIAGAKQDRRLAEIPLTEVFVTQPVQAGPPEYDVPDEPSWRGPDFDSPATADGASDEGQPDEEIEPLLELPPGIASSLTEPSVEVLGRERQQVFLGAPGSGKSTLLLDAALLLCDTSRDPATLPAGLRGAPLPFFLELRQYVLGKATSFVDYIATSATQQYGVEIDAESIQAALSAKGRALVMFDGLDEVFDPAAQSRVIDEFRAFARRHPDAQVVVTSRIAGYRALELERDGFRHYTLLGFGMPEIREFVPKWYTYYTWQGDLRDASGLIRRISESPRLLELARNPLLLTMMAVIYKHQDLPEKRWQLYARCTEVLLEDWDVKRKNIDRNLLLPLGFTMVADQKAELLQRVSMYMLEHRHTGSELNAIAREPLLKILASYLQEQYGKTPGEARAVASEILDHLRERTYIIAEIGEQQFGFVHRTFMEFFAAEYCTAEFNRREADYDWLTRELFGKRWRQDEWREVLLLLVGMLKDQGSPVQKLIDYLRREQVQGLPVQLGFAARCLAEASAVDDAWSRTLLAELAIAISSITRQPSNAATQSFLDDALGSFAVLVSTVSLSAKARKSVDELGQDQSLRSRIIGFQLQLALRSKEDRLAFALEALGDQEEAVRRGAIAALEREWPGRQEIFTPLLDVLRSDRLSRVRSAALQALERSWPPDPEILEALDDRAAVETAYTSVIQLMHYLARRWGGDRRALEILLTFSEGRKIRIPENLDIRAVQAQIRDAAMKDIVDGWRQAGYCKSFLQERWSESNDQSAVIALLALAQSFPDDSETTAWIRAQLIADANPGRRGKVLSALLQARPNDKDLHLWARQQAMNDKDSSVRRSVISALSLDEGDKAGLAWFEERLAIDPDATVRQKAMEVWATAQPRDNRNSLLRDRAIHDEAGQIRAQALKLLGESETARQLRELLLQQGASDPDARVRQEAIRLLARYDDPSTENFLRDRLHKDSDESVRITDLWTLALIKAKFSSEAEPWAGDIVAQLDPQQLLWWWDYARSELPPSDFIWGYGHMMLRNLVEFILSREAIRLRNSPGLEYDYLTEAALSDGDPIIRGYAIILAAVTMPAHAIQPFLERCIRQETDDRVKELVSLLMESGKIGEVRQPENGGARD